MGWVTGWVARQKTVKDVLAREVSTPGMAGNDEIGMSYQLRFWWIGLGRGPWMASEEVEVFLRQDATDAAWEPIDWIAKRRAETGAGDGAELAREAGSREGGPAEEQSRPLEG